MNRAMAAAKRPASDGPAGVGGVDDIAPSLVSQFRSVVTRDPRGAGVRPPARGGYAAWGRYWRQVAGIVGDASWMKMCAPGVCGLVRGCMLTWCGSRSALRRLHGAHEATMLSQPEPPPLERGIT